MAGEWPQNAADYINGHLVNLAVGDGPAAFHIDTFFVALALGIGGLFGLSRVAARAKVESPSKTQLFFEMLFEFFDRQIRDLFPNAPALVGPLAMTIFVWVFLMNSMDLVPVDLVAATSYALTGEAAHFKLVPTTDLSLTLALALSVFALTIYYNFKNKGFIGFGKEVMSAPFGMKMAPVNVLLRVVEELARPLSLSMRLFGNLFAAEMIFLLIASLSYVGWFGFLLQWIPGGPWAIYHILVVPLQAFIFAILAVVYLAMAHESHSH